MINKYPSYSSIQEWADKLKDYELDNVYFSVKGKPRVKLKSKDQQYSGQAREMHPNFYNNYFTFPYQHHLGCLLFGLL